MTPRTGRPKVDNPRTRMVTARFNEAEHETLKAAAEGAGQDLGPWCRATLLAAAKRAAKASPKA